MKPNKQNPRQNALDALKGEYMKQLNLQRQELESAGIQDALKKKGTKRRLFEIDQAEEVTQDETSDEEEEERQKSKHKSKKKKTKIHDIDDIDSSNNDDDDQEVTITQTTAEIVQDKNDNNAAGACEIEANRETLVRDCAYTIAHSFYAKELYVKTMYAIAIHQEDIILKHWNCNRMTCDVNNQNKNQCIAWQIACRTRYLLNAAFRSNRINFPKTYRNPLYSSTITEDCLKNTTLKKLEEELRPIWAKIQYVMYNQLEERKRSYQKLPPALNGKDERPTFRRPKPNYLT